MTKFDNSRIRILHLLRLLKENTDENNTMTILDMIYALSCLEIFTVRKTIYSDIEILRSFGVDIVRTKSKTFDYYIATRDFELAELKILIAAIKSSNLITMKKSKKLIGKLCKLTSKHRASDLLKTGSVDEKVKTTNESILYSIDAIHNAFHQDRKISFKYIEYTIDKQKKLRHNGESYTISPYGMVWSNGNYYLVGYYERCKRISHFRLDRISVVEILIDKRNEEAQTFNLDKYVKRLFDMYSGELTTVELQFNNSLINIAVDKFGEDITITKKTMNYFIVSVDVVVSPPFFAWLFQFGNKVKILSPGKVKQDYMLLGKASIDGIEG